MSNKSVYESVAEWMEWKKIYDSRDITNVHREKFAEVDRKRKEKNDRARLKALWDLEIITKEECEDPGRATDKEIEEILERHDVVLVMDGGGYHIHFTLQLLLSMEEKAGIPCHKIFNSIGGTSAGAITAALLVNGYSARQCEEFWDDKKIFSLRNPILGPSCSMLKTIGLNTWASAACTVNYMLAPPLCDKTYLRNRLKEILGSNVTLQGLASKTFTDVAMMVQDMNAGSYGALIPMESFVDMPDDVARYISSHAGGMASPDSAALAWAVAETAGSPPIYQQPMGSYIDAGFGAGNNPVLSIMHSRAHLNFLTNLARPDERPKKPKKITVISIGTNMDAYRLVSEELARNPLLPFFFWIQYFNQIIYAQTSCRANEAMEAISRLSQIYNYHNKDNDKVIAMPEWHYTRIEMNSNMDVIRRLDNEPFAPVPGICAKNIHQLTPRDLYLVQFGALDADYNPIYKALGKAASNKLKDKGHKGLESLLNQNTSDRRSAEEDFADQEWVNAQPSKTPWPFGFMSPVIWDPMLDYMRRLWV